MIECIVAVKQKASQVLFSLYLGAPRAHASVKMLPAEVLFTIACAFVTVFGQNDAINKTNNAVLRRLAPLLETNKTLDTRDLQLLTKTAEKLGVDKEIIEKFIANKTEPPKHLVDVNKPSYNAYEGIDGKETPKIRVIEESPDYASSLVLASDLLSLTSAVASVKEDVCREQGYNFLDGLILNKRWALKSEYLST